MKIKLSTNQEKYTKLKKMLEKGGFEVTDDADLVLEDNSEKPYFLGTHKEEIIPIPYHDILYIESYGRDVYINTIDKFIKINKRLYEVESFLEGLNFLRISKSVIVNKKGIKKIKSIINGRFDLVMMNGEKVTVTKSYRHDFKSFIGF